MRRWMCSTALALLCLLSWRHDPVDAGWKHFKHGNRSCAGCAAPMMVGCQAPWTCGMPMGCAAPGCYAPACAGPGCYAPNFHRPFAPLVAHYGMGCAGPGCYGPACSAPYFGCAAPMGCGCGVPRMGCAAPMCGMPMGAYGDVDGAAMPYQPDVGLEGMPLLSATPGVSNYYAPVGPMSAPIPSVPPAEDLVW